MSDTAIDPQATPATPPASPPADPSQPTEPSTAPETTAWTPPSFVDKKYHRPTMEETLRAIVDDNKGLKTQIGQKATQPAPAEPPSRGLDRPLDEILTDVGITPGATTLTAEQRQALIASGVHPQAVEQTLAYRAAENQRIVGSLRDAAGGPEAWTAIEENINKVPVERQSLLMANLQAGVMTAQEVVSRIRAEIGMQPEQPASGSAPSMTMGGGTSTGFGSKQELAEYRSKLRASGIEPMTDKTYLARIEKTDPKLTVGFMNTVGQF